MHALLRIERGCICTSRYGTRWMLILAHNPDALLFFFPIGTSVELSSRVDELQARVAGLEHAARPGGGLPTALRHRTGSMRERSTRRLLGEMHDEAKARTEVEQRKATHKDPYVYAACAGIIGAVSVLLGGVVSRIILLSFAGDAGQAWKEWYTYLFIVLLLTTITGQTAFLNAGMERGDVMAVYPVFQAFWIGFGTVGSVFLYWEVGRHFSVEQDGLYTAALVLMLIGVRFLFKHVGAGGGEHDGDGTHGAPLANAAGAGSDVESDGLEVSTGVAAVALPVSPRDASVNDGGDVKAAGAQV